MRRWLFVCLLALAPGGLAQTGDWQSLIAQAAAFDRAGRYVEAVAGYRCALRLAGQSSLGDSRLPSILNALASASSSLGDFREAERQYRQAISLVEKGGGKEGADYALLLQNLANLYSEQGRLAKAEAMLREALAIESRALGADDARTATVGSSLAQVLLSRGNFGEADKLLAAAIPVLESQPPVCADCLPAAIDNLGTLRFRQRRFAEAAAALQRSVTGFEAALGPAHPRLLRPLNNLALAYAALGRAQDAESIFRRAFSIAEARLGSNPDCVLVLANFAAFLRKSGRKVEAKAWERRSQQYARAHGIGLTVDISAFQ